VLVEGGDRVLAVPAAAVDGPVDPCGAGDRFAVEAALVLGAGGLPSEAVVAAVAAASTFGAAGGAAAITCRGSQRAAVRLPATPASPPASSSARQTPTLPADQVVAATRAAGGTVVATGGCFDLLHAGHVRVLQAARRLGDCLIVLVNDDDSVRSLKGPDRPVIALPDRLAVLAALDCVDGVVGFSGPTPIPMIERLRPDIWAKGADYDADRLPEAAVLASWGGRAVTVPYLDGRSTSSVIDRIRTR
jgi:rfaE bifunctional protein nucleotidyltransferase chain/domain